MRVLGLAVLLLVGGSFAVEAQSNCTCTTSASDHAVKDLGRYKSAFAGKVVSVEPDGRVTFEVLRVWKGPRAKTLSLKSSGPESCRFPFEQGGQYLVYANGEKEALSTDRCAPNAHLQNAATQMRQLDLHTGQSASPLRLQ